MGLERMRMGEIASRAGISRASLYRHFASKEDLIGSWTLREIDRLFEHVDGILDVDDEDLRLGRAVVASLDWLREHPVFSAVAESGESGLIRVTLLSDSSVAAARVGVAERSQARDVSEAASELLVRVVISLAQAPASVLNVRDPAVAGLFEASPLVAALGKDKVHAIDWARVA